jgi:hypothetical protein
MIPGVMVKLLESESRSVKASSTTNSAPVTPLIVASLDSLEGF